MSNTVNKTPQQVRKERSTLFLGITWFDLIGLAIMICVGLIPAPEPLTQAGMQVLGVLLGIVFIFSAVGSSWGIFLAWIMLAAPAKELGVAGAHGIWAVTSITLGDWLAVFVLLSTLLCIGLKQSGFMGHFAHWFMNLKFTRKSPWHFLFAWMLLAFVMGFFIETVTVCVFLLPIAYSIFERAGFKPGDKYPGCMVIGTVLGALCSYSFTPIGFGAGYKGMALALEYMDGNMHMIGYMLLSLPGAAAAFTVMFLIFKYVVKPDTSKMEGANYEALIGEKPAPLTKSSYWTIGIYLVVLFFWIVPSFMDMLAPDLAITKWMDEQTSVGFALMGLVAMCLIKIDGKPLLDLKKALPQVPWTVYFVMATTRGVATCLGKGGTGFNAWVNSFIENIGLNGWLLVAVVCLLLVIATQFASNAPITALGIAAIVPAAAALGTNSVTTAIMVTNAAGLAMTLPSGFAFLGYLSGDEWNLKGPQLAIGTACVLVNLLFSISLIYLVGGAIF